MAASKFELQKATLEDASDMARVFFEAFCREPQPQAKFYEITFPETPGTTAFFVNSFIEQMRTEPDSVFLKVVDKETGRMAGMGKWAPPGHKESHWEEFSAEMNEELATALFSGFGTNRSNLMGDRPHWFLEIMGVSSDYQRKGVGAMMVEHGCNLADRDGVEAYVDGSPVGSPLYKKYGFVLRNQEKMPAPFDWYIEEFLVRPAKQK